jgi:class 3 adenylate cyclase
MAVVCGSCGATAPDGARFCPACGASLTTPGAPTEERKLATILFADVIGSTALGERIDPERLRLILGEYFAAMSEVIGAWGGTVEKYIGDAIMAAFGVPMIREDDARRALSAALEMIARLKSLNGRLLERHGVSLALRVGVNTGEVIAPVGDGDQLIVAGDAVNTAARLQSAADPGSILVGARTWLATRDAFSFGQPRRLELSGKAAPVEARVLEGRLVEPARGIPGLRAPLVGRDRELATLRSLLEESIERGEPRLAVVYGAAGIGKSRLVWELVQDTTGRRPDSRVLRGRCLAAGHGITYWALAEILRAAVGIRLDDPAEVVGERLRDGLAELLSGDPGGDDREVVGALAITVGITLPDDPLARLEPRAVDEAIGRAWPRFLTALGARGPVVIVVEDLHWAGSQLVETLTRMAGRSSGPILIVATARPDFAESQPGFGAAVAGFTAISLNPLSPEQSNLLVEGLLAIADLPEDRRQAVVERAEGNPYFIEEIVRRMIDEGAIVRDGDRWRATEKARSMALPDTIHALLAARIDALTTAERAVIHEASVVGKVFWPAPLRTALPTIDVFAALRSLEDRGLVVARPTSTIAGETEYLFRHALVRDVAYAALPRARRARAHSDVAAWTEGLAGDRADEFGELLAFHYRAAVVGEDADLAWTDEPDRREALRRDAIRWLTTAGNAARRRYALDHAIELHDQAAALAAGDAERAVVLEALGDDHAAAYHGDASVERYMAALDALGTGDGGGMRARLLMKAAREAVGKSGSFRTQPRPAEIERWIDGGLEAGPDESTRGWLLALRGGIRGVWAGLVGDDPVSPEDRIAAVSEARAIARRINQPSLEDYALVMLESLYFMAGRFDLALQASEERLTFVEGSGPSDQAATLMSVASAIGDIAGDFPRAVDLAQRSLAIAHSLSTHERLHATGQLIDLYFQMGRWSKAREILADHMAAFAEEKDVSCAGVRAGPLVGALLHAHLGDGMEARRLLDLAPRLERVSGYSDGTRARCLAVLGQTSNALAIVDDILSRPLLRANAYAHLARLEALEPSGAWSDIAAAAAAAAPLSGGNVQLATALDRIGGRAAAAQGEPAAVDAIRRAIDRCDLLGLRFEAARAREALADTTAEPGAARELMEDALVVYEELGARPAADRVKERLAAYETSAPSS